MRFLSYLFGILILVNLVVLAWPQQNTTAPHLSAKQEEVNPHFIRLNKEIETRFYTQVEQVADIDNTSSTNSIALLPERGDEASSTLADKVCYRVGPFTHRPNYELAQAVLFNAKIDFKKTRRESRESIVTRLYLGPYSGKAQVEDMRTRLRQAGVLDHFVRKQDDDYIISLGIYSSDVSSDAAFQLFKEKVSSIQQREETVVLPESYWLHFGLREEQTIKRQFAAMDWGEPSAKMGLHECLNG